MDAQKKSILLELCDCMDTRVQVLDAHLTELACGAPTKQVAQRLIIPGNILGKLREELSFLRKNLQCEPRTVRSS